MNYIALEYRKYWSPILSDLGRIRGLGLRIRGLGLRNRGLGLRWGRGRAFNTEHPLLLCMCVVASRWIAKRLLPEIENKRDTEDWKVFFVLRSMVIVQHTSTLLSLCSVRWLKCRNKQRPLLYPPHQYDRIILIITRFAYGNIKVVT